MPFDEEDPKEFVPKIGVKQIQGQESMFKNKPRIPTQQEFEKQVKQSQETLSGYKKRAAELFIQFNQAMANKTLPQNRNILNNETEREMLQNMIQLAMDINNDPNEVEDMGALTLITLLFKTCMSQRDRLNELEYAIVNLQKKTDNAVISDLVNKEINKTLDKKKDSE